MFETLGIPAFHLSPKVVLSLYATGNIIGTALYSGDTVSCAVPIYEGHVLPHAFRHQFFSGRDLTDNLMRVLCEHGQCSVTNAERAIVQEVKEKLCYVALDFEREVQSADSSLEKSYELPDGRVITLDNNECFKCPEALFKPSTDYPTGIHEITHHSIIKCDVELHRDLYANIVLSGGSTLFPGFRARVIVAMASPSTEVKVISPPQSHNSVWVGGSSLASLSTFKQMCISKQEYEEFGAGIIHCKCF